MTSDLMIANRLTLTSPGKEDGVEGLHLRQFPSAEPHRVRMLGADRGESCGQDATRSRKGRPAADRQLAVVESSRQTVRHLRRKCFLVGEVPQSLYLWTSCKL
jgi:hypothetical protein